MSDRAAPPQPTLVSRLGPLGLATLLIVLDQLTKAWVISWIPHRAVGWTFGGDFFYLTHQRNLGVAFSLGHSLPEEFRLVLFVVVPLVVLAGLVVWFWRDRTLSTYERWCVGAVLGGGFGNLIDRLFRPEGVIDFLSFKFYGLLGMDRFATFNVADAAVSVGGTLFVLALLFGRKRS